MGWEKCELEAVGEGFGAVFLVDLGEGLGRPHLTAVVDNGCGERVEEENAGAGCVDVEKVAPPGDQVAGAGPLFQVAPPYIFESIARVKKHAKVEEGGRGGEGLIVVEDGWGEERRVEVKRESLRISNVDSEAVLSAE